MSKIVVRRGIAEDVAQMCILLNDVIQIGGTTAYQSLFSDSAFAEKFLDGEDSRCCLVAIDNESTIAGFQTLHRHPDLPDDWLDIATFARATSRIPGVGTALFAQTKQIAIEADIAAINAAIRADNQGGLAYYEKMGFVTYSVKKDVPLADGSRVDRVFKRYTCR